MMLCCLIKNMNMGQDINLRDLYWQSKDEIVRTANFLVDVFCNFEINNPG